MTDPRIGRFEVRRELGRGAQSVVYLAWDPHLQREVAIKTLHFAHADPEQDTRLLAEARTVGRLRHANVVPIFDAGEQDGDLYLVFEYVPGCSLYEALARDGAMPSAKAADLMRQVLDALVQAHALGIIHRDLKPSNILLDEQGMPRVMDFGIASTVIESSPQRSSGLAGTPAYMAPEYINDRVVNERNDIFAAGLILLEILTGKRVFQGGGAISVMARIASENVMIPRDANIDDRLAAIVLRACSRDPQSRFASAADMRQALADFLGVGAEGEAGASAQGTLDFLLRRMRHKSDFPALSDSVAAINKLTQSDRESINSLANSLLKDYALTNKILRLVNSAYYRQAGGGSISTVSRAVIVLGFDTIRNIAITVLLFEHLQDKANARELKEAFLRANLAGILARDVAARLLPRDGEEAFICALFHNLGQLLAQYYFPEEIEEVRKLMQAMGLSESAAAMRVLGISFEDLGTGIARTWGFPGGIVNSMRRLPAGTLHKPAGRDETLRLLAGFANEFCESIAASAADAQGKMMHLVSDRFGASLQASEQQLQRTLEKSLVELAEVAATLRVNLKQSAFVRQARTFTLEEPTAVVEPSVDASLTSTLLESAPAAIEADEPANAAAVVPDDAQAILAAGIQDISNSLVEDASLNDILRITLETMYRAMGFQRVLLCLRDRKTETMAGRFGFGADIDELMRKFRFPLCYAADVFHLATGKGADIIIADIDDPKIADRVPAWYRGLTISRTFVLFPLNIKGAPVALIYCDKERAQSIVIPEKELALLKTLRNQALLAIKQSL